MTRAQHFFKNEDIENFMTWWFGIVFNSRETIQKMLRSDDMEEFFSREKTQKALWSDEFEKSSFWRERILETLWSDDLEEAYFQLEEVYFQEKRY